MSLIGARDLLCVNGQFNGYRGNQLNTLCKKSREAGKGPNACVFYKNTGESCEPNGFRWQAHDIEDLYELGMKLKVCPYYLQKNRLPKSDLILMPYNYVIDEKIRENLKLDFENSIIILDEAHNIKRICEEAASFEVHLGLLNGCLQELGNLIGALELKAGQEDYHFKSNVHGILEIMCMTKNFKHYLIDFKNPKNKLHIPEFQQTTEAVYPGDTIFDLFFHGTSFKSYPEYNGPDQFQGLSVRNFGHWSHIFEKAIIDIGQMSTQDKPTLDRWWDCIKRVIKLFQQSSLGGQRHRMDADYSQDVNHFRVFIQDGEQKGEFKSRFSSKNQNQRVLKFLCFSPGIGF
jgi:Rad3-related DNA helicase